MTYVTYNNVRSSSCLDSVIYDGSLYTLRKTLESSLEPKRGVTHVKNMNTNTNTNENTITNTNTNDKEEENIENRKAQK